MKSRASSLQTTSKAPLGLPIPTVHFRILARHVTVPFVSSCFTAAERQPPPYALSRRASRSVSPWNLVQAVQQGGYRKRATVKLDAKKCWISGELLENPEIYNRRSFLRQSCTLDKPWYAPTISCLKGPSVPNHSHRQSSAFSFPSKKQPVASAEP